MSEELEALNLIITRLNPSPDNVSKAMNEVKIVENALKNYEWLKSVISIDMFDQLPTPEDKIRFLKIMGVELWIKSLKH